jgi:hypothetical protein
MGLQFKLYKPKRFGRRRSKRLRQQQNSSDDEKSSRPVDPFAHVPYNSDPFDSNDVDTAAESDAEMEEEAYSSYSGMNERIYRWQSKLFNKLISSSACGKKALQGYCNVGFFSPSMGFRNPEQATRAKKYLESMDDWQRFKHVFYISHDGCYKISPDQCSVICDVIVEFGDPEQDEEFITLFQEAKKHRYAVKYC